MDKKYIIIHVHGEGKDNAWRNLFNYDIEIKRIDTKKGYIIIPIYNSSEESEEIKRCLSNIIKENKIIGEIYICAHCDSFSLKSVKAKTYRGTNSYAYCLIDLATRKYKNESDSYYVQKNCKKFPDFETVKKNLGFEPDPKELLLSFLTPLHLSLQAFWGISTDESRKSEAGSKMEIVEFVKFGARKDGNNEILKKIHTERGEYIRNGLQNIGEYKDNFTKPEAFLLVPEAEWDFYAPLLSRVMPPSVDSESKKDVTFNCPEEEKEYSIENNIAILLEKLSQQKESEGLARLRRAFENEYGKETEHEKDTSDPSKPWFEISHNVGKVSYAQFVKSLREIAAILANTVDKTSCHKIMKLECRKNQEVDASFVYKGKYEVENILKLLKNFKNENSHCKLPDASDISTKEYSILANQIADWGIEKAMIVIVGIEKLANLLQ